MAAWGYEFYLLVLKVSSIYIAENVISCSLTSLPSYLTPGNAEVV